jgi:hypothetical protein
MLQKNNQISKSIQFRKMLNEISDDEEDIQNIG